MANCPFCVITRRNLVRSAMGSALALATGSLALASRAVAQEVPGLTSEQLAHGTADFSQYVDGPADFYTIRLTFAPGAFIDWHTHPGPVFGIVTAGTLTDVYDQLGCKTSFGPGAAVYIPRGLTHQDRNDGKEALVVMATFIVPAGSVLRLPADNIPAGAPCGMSEAVAATGF
jgi:quercetin dioxygenase-like cupin family protein